ncbi:MAG: hypothetical protein IMX00_11365 [Limnochordales bacterium]|nr:hypothetical protein [Limnochordales bacterium]
MWQLLRTFVWVAVSVELLLVLRLLAALLWHRRMLRGRPSVPDSPPHLVLLLPALREQPIVEETVRHFGQLVYPYDRLSVLIVTTEREEHEYRLAGQNDVVTTSQLVARAIEAANRTLGTTRFLHLHYPYTTGNKASQLSYAVRQLPKLLKDLPANETYIGV